MDIQSIMAKVIPAVEFMYDKKAEIKRYGKIVKPSGADGMDWVPKHSDVPCRLSTPKLDNAVQGGANVINYDVKMFLSSNYDVLAGDIVIVDGVEYESAKEPFVYVSHQEVLLIRKGYA
ncbi:MULTISPECIES: hypothetical protein [unclassified Lysinibacillus]|uniref:hypothetical protein n=1 Tax=unclassified Lysinibacillus TaxID=2636778 RepID=UPI00381D0E59